MLMVLPHLTPRELALWELSLRASLRRLKSVMSIKLALGFLWYPIAVSGRSVLHLVFRVRDLNGRVIAVLELGLRHGHQEILAAQDSTHYRGLDLNPLWFSGGLIQVKLFKISQLLPVRSVDWSTPQGDKLIDFVTVVRHHTFTSSLIINFLPV
jgi:hypothetical protein